jgi:hypothetical protein
MKKFLSSLIALTLLFLNLSSAKADPTYAVLDSDGNVTNIIVCGAACASGEFNGNKVVLQVAPDPITNENRGGIWQGEGTTTYDSNTSTFTVTDQNVITVVNSLTEKENETEVTSSAIINGKTTIQFKYNDTIGDNLFIRNGFSYGWAENSSATLSVNRDNIIESLNFDSRKTENQIQESIQNSQLTLLNSKIQTLISLLGSWVK